MSSPRQIYQYVVAGISFQAVLWSVIGLMRELFLGTSRTSSMGLIAQLSIIIIGLPVFLIHWLWGQRLALKDEEERGSAVRQLFLYSQLAGLLGPMIDSTFAILGALIVSGTGESYRWHWGSFSTMQEVFFYGLALLALIPCWYYFRQQVKQDEDRIHIEGTNIIIRQLYTYAYAAVGLGITYYGALDLFLLLFDLPDIISGHATRMIGTAVLLITARLAIGLSLWTFFWRSAQDRFLEEDIDERHSPVRGWYLYLLIFTSFLSAVTSFTLILEGFLRRLLQASSSPQSGDDLALGISVIICSGVVWFFHSRVLRQDALLETEMPRRESMRRIYHYLMAGLAFAVLLTGVVGLLITFFTAIDGGHLASYLRAQLALYISILLISIPIWWYFWNIAQTRAAAEGREGMDERESLPRRIYLYAFMLVGTLVLLGTAISLVMRFLALLIGEPSMMGGDLTRMLAYAILASLVLGYHVQILRSDRSLGVPVKAKEDAEQNVVLLYKNRQEFADQLIKRFTVRKIAAQIQSVQVSSDVGQSNDSKEIKDKLQGADVIILAWDVMLDGEGISRLLGVLDELKASKILIPVWKDGWDWAGVERWNQERLINQAIYAARQALSGREVKIQKSIGCGAIIGIILLVLVGLSVLVSALVNIAF